MMEAKVAPKPKVDPHWLSRQEQFAALVKTPGANQDEVQKRIGKPNHIELVDGKLVTWYDDKDVPWYVVFKNGKLDSVYVDGE